MASNAIEDAKDIDDIEFPEFTAKLITDTFSALIDANITQMEAYAELLKVVGTTLSAYINNTKDFIAAEDVLAFLGEKLPSPRSDTDHSSTIYKEKSLSADDATELNNVLKFDPDSNVTPTTYAAGNTLTGAVWDTLMEELAQLLAQNKYQIFKEMVNQGMLRLVINDGTIETRLHFYARSTKHTYQNQSDYQRNTERNRKSSGFGGGLFGLFGGGYSKKSTSTSVKVATARSGERTYDTTSVSLFGGVKLNFKTDYLKLSE